MTRAQEGRAISAQITIPLDIPDVRVPRIEISARGECTITFQG